MRLGIVAMTAGLALNAGQAFALCMDGPPFACTIGGRPGERQCVNGRITACIPTGGTASTTGSAVVLPKYYILTVVYAPPGTKGGSSTSSVSYGAGSTTGTTVSASNSFKQAYAVKATAGGGALGSSATIGVSFGYGRQAGDESSLSITKSSTSTINDTGPPVDGIDHDHDLIYLWLNPSLKLSVTNNSAAWTVQGGTAEVQYLYVGWLKNPATMPPGVQQVLQKYKLTEQDYAQILKQNPFAATQSPVTGARFQPLNTTFPYEPPYTEGGPVPTFSFTLSSAAEASTAQSVENDYDVGVSLSAETNVGVVKASLEASASWTWSNKATTGASGSTTQSATVTIGGPSFGYSGSTSMEVFYDRIYKTFVFRPIEGDARPGMSGQLKAANGRPLAFKEVMVTAGGKTYRTVTNAQGEYKVFGAVSGPLTLRANGIARSLNAVPATRKLDLTL